MPDLKTLKLSDGVISGRPDIEMSMSSGLFTSGPTFYTGTGVAVQDAVRALMTKFGTNYLAPNFGTNIPDIIMSRTADKNLSVISNQSQYSLGYMSMFRSSDAPSESISQINSLATKRTGETIQMTLTLTTGAGEQAIVEVI
jgi:hypothetical protein